MNSKKKKKLLLLILTLIMTTLLCGCVGKPKEFKCNGLNVTLTSDFKKESSKKFNIYIESSDIAFSAVRESAHSLEFAGYEIASLKDYSTTIAEMNGSSASALEKRNNYYYFINKKTVQGAKYTYLHCMFYDEINSSYWICEFVTKTKNYDGYKKDIFKWADSITFTQISE